jgi:DNA-binding SARP family transcriptional activator
MDFRVLGPLEVIRAGRPLALGGHKRRALLLVLLLESNRVVSSARLIDALWEEAPPATAQKALQLYVSQLRKLLGRERLQTKVPGYLLRVEPDELDLKRFERLQNEGRLREALALWRGQPLAEFADQRFAQAEIARLEELRLTCLEELAEHDLARGRHDELVGELEARVQEHPLRERARRQLMLALYRSGRQAEALEAYRAARAALVEELGIEPGRQLRDLHEAVLKQDPALDLEPADAAPTAEPVPRRSPPATRAPPVREVRKTVTVLAAVVSASSGRGARLDPEALRRVSRRGFAEINAAAEAHGGSIETTTGNVAMAIFGVPGVHEDDALRALRAAQEARGRVTAIAPELEAHWGARLELRMGVSTGEVVVGGDQLQPAGEPLSVAYRLAQAAGAGEIAFDEETNRFARDVLVVEQSDNALLLVDVRRAPAGHVGRFDAPMIGRERERRRLHDVFEVAVGDRSCQLFTVLGPAGVGKSRLVQEFVTELAGKAHVARGRCLPYGEGITYWPLLEAVKEAVGLGDADSSDEARSRLVRVLAGDAGAELIAHHVAGIIGLEEAGAGPEEGFAAVRAFFENLAHARPLTVVFDDVHWGEKTFLDLVEHLADWTRDAAILLVCLARPELLDVRPGWGGGKLNATTALLEPLSDTESMRLVENLGGRGLTDRDRHRIVNAAEGNPLFAEEMYALVSEAGDEAQPEVPATIQALLAARLDRLQDEERGVIEAASVDGKVFHEGVVAALVSEALRPSVPDMLMALVRKELIRPDRSLFAGDRAYRFRHLLIRDAAYDSIPKEARAAMHERYAAWLEEKAGARTVEFEEILGYHLEQAYRYRAELGPVDEASRALARHAAEHLAVAGRRAFVRTDAPAAVKLLSRAVALLPPGDPARVDLVPTVRVAQGLRVEDLDWAFEALEDAVEAGDERLRAHALVQRGLLRLFTGSEATTSGLVAIAEQAIRVFSRFGDELGLARGWRLVDQAEYQARRAGPSVDAAERALVHARRAGDRFEEREIVQFLLTSLILGPEPARGAITRCERLLAAASSDPVLEINALGALAYFLAIQGRSAEAQELLARGRRLTVTLGPGYWVPPVYFALSAAWQDDPVALERELRPGHQALTQIEEKSNFSSLAALLAEAVYAQGRYDEAEALVQEARAASQPIDVQCQTIWRTVTAKVLARRGTPERAEKLISEAIAYVEQSDFLPVQAQALMDRAEVLELAGRADAACRVLEEVERLWERKGNLVAAAHARERRARGSTP